MPMSREDHENLLNELLTPDLDHTRRTEILQQLRTQHTQDVTDFEELTNTSTRLQADNDDLVIANSKLFRQLGVTKPEDKKEEETKEFSETITLEDIEKGF